MIQLKSQIVTISSWRTGNSGGNHGKSVTSIGDIAFYDHENLTSVIIPVGVTTIKWAAFSLCSNLKSVVMPDGMKILEVQLLRAVLI